MRKRVYGKWAGCPKGKPENIEKCIQVIWKPQAYFSTQCSRYRGYGDDGLYCKYHAEINK